jgi:hypothetical protein
VGDELNMSVEKRWNDIGRGVHEVPGGNLLHCKLFRYKFQMDWPVTDALRFRPVITVWDKVERKKK